MIEKVGPRQGAWFRQRLELLCPIRAEIASHEAADYLRLGGELVSHQLQLHQPDGRIGHPHPIDTARLAVRSRRIYQDAGRSDQRTQTRFRRLQQRVRNTQEVGS